MSIEEALEPDRLLSGFRHVTAAALRDDLPHQMVQRIEPGDEAPSEAEGDCVSVLGGELDDADPGLAKQQPEPGRAVGRLEAGRGRVSAR